MKTLNILLPTALIIALVALILVSFFVWGSLFFATFFSAALITALFALEIAQEYEDNHK